MRRQAENAVRSRLSLALLCLCFGSHAVAQPSLTYQAASTKRMANLPLRIYQQQDWKTDPSKEAARAAYYRASLQQLLDLRTKLKARVAPADALLRADGFAVQPKPAPAICEEVFSR